MNGTVLSLAMVAALALGAVRSARAASPFPATALETALGSITVERSREWVETLADDRFEGRGTGTDGLLAASKWIAGRLEQAGAAPLAGRSYFQKFGRMRNVLAKIEGETPDEYVIVGAHYDHLGTDLSSGGKDKIFNGADDNASGVAGVLHLAHAFAATGQKPRRTVIFALWDGEETTGLAGSRGFARRFGGMDRVKAYLNLDMIGRDPGGTRGEVMFFSANSSGWADRLREDAARYTSALEPVTDPETLVRDFEDFVFRRPWVEGPEAIVLRGNSDYLPFRKAGIPAWMVTTGLHDDLHTPGDESAKIDFQKMTDVSRLVFVTVHRLVNGD
jgi:Zn-dependent M28 family amino/carboxypeptidase